MTEEDGADGTEAVVFVVRTAFTAEGHGTVVAGVLAAGELRVGDELEWARGDASRLTRCLGLAELRQDPPLDPPLSGVLVEGLEPADLAPGDLLRTPTGAATPGPGGRGAVALAVDGPELNVFEAVGGRAFFDRVVQRFYAGVEADPVIRPLYPDDLTESIRNTAGFLAQYWGGGTAQYSDERGHPRLRMRHGHVAIDVAGRDRWVHHMTEAVQEEHLPAEIEAKLLAYFEMGATAMVNAER
ncbi:hypothetical protein BH10ACT1_BH10ACT1_10570 [soil metagenome]